MRKIILVSVVGIFTVAFSFFVYVFFNQLPVKSFFGASLVSSQMQNTPPNESPGPDIVPLQNLQDQLVPAPPRDDTVIIDNQILPSGAINDKQDQIDDILEKIDILKRRITDLQALEQPKVQTTDVVMVLVDKNVPADQQNQLVYDTPKISGGRGGSSSTFYPKLLISEVQIGGSAGEKEEFIELYNPNNQDIDLTGWYIHKNTKKDAIDYQTFVSKTLFLGKKINANGYFLIVRQGSGFLGDIVVDSPLTQDNSLILKNPNGDISDKVGWGLAQDYELSPAQNPFDGQSIGRKPDQKDSENNATDFETDTPTPKSPNILYIAPIPAIIAGATEQVVLKNMLISQIQTAGATAKDEFVELYNPNDVGVDLTGFSLKKKTFSDDNPEGTESNVISSGSFLGSIAARGYFLAAPKQNDDGTENYTGIMAPDIRYSGETFSIANNNTLLLYNAEGVLLDVVGFGDAGDFETTSAPNPPIDKSIGRIKDANGNVQDTDNNSADFQIQEAAPHNADIIAPEIFDIQALNISQDGATIAWQTNEISSSFVEYGQDALYGFSTSLDGPLVTSHAVALSGLLPNTEYHYRVKNQDAMGNEAISLDKIFTTLVFIDSAPPVITSGLPSGQLPSGTGQVEASVTTDEPATCKYTTIPGQPYDEIADVFLVTGGIVHTTILGDLVDGSDYTYYVACTDVLENKNTDDFIIAFNVALPEPPLEPPPASPPQTNVVINEIAWMGGVDSSGKSLPNDEWIELFNPGDQVVDLSGWRIAWNENTSIELSGFIDPQGFYLLERTDDNSVPDVAADQIYKGALVNPENGGGEHLYLYDVSGNTMDEINCSDGWFAGNNDTKQTMQRKDPLSSGNDAQNWQTSDAPGGTPKS
ncbi:MAG: hypothetical protein A2908_01580 [Candidatus Staskawiczbacteria bacterium RIFCSPLOWO2_01_FULL_38_12b]|uniref:LTD domain-containing protein n=1 Tax=Candidatus Staskawiczbacteria bacterium RIFCSPLOWO2_01_FULL_38_12b TaxID=1802214 RepID=A0A1G2ICU0_9BACT|nr:MAG: hypothetical protein A2908_01580 [Candidatus Staskawiczbacteria bacterium RIFCSPLOWO2_01_FULL_38_12b]